MEGSMAIPVIGVLTSAKGDSFLDPLREGLSDNGFKENTDYKLDHRPGGNYKKLKQNALDIKNANGADLKLVIAGGMVAGQAAAIDVWPSPSMLPLLIVTGREDARFTARGNTGGYVLENAAPPSMNKQRVQILASNYGIAA